MKTSSSSEKRGKKELGQPHNKNMFLWSHWIVFVLVFLFVEQLQFNTNINGLTVVLGTAFITYILRKKSALNKIFIGFIFCKRRGLPLPLNHSHAKERVRGSGRSRLLTGMAITTKT